MKELIFAGRPVLVGDAAADAVVDYTAVLMRASSADAVELRALDQNGRSIEVYYVLGGAAPVMAQTVDSSHAEPDNVEAVRYMRAAMRRLDPGPLEVGFDYLDDASPSDFVQRRSHDRDDG